MLKIDHLENDTKIMNGKIEQLRSDCRQQEKTKKDLAEQLRFQVGYRLFSDFRAVTPLFQEPSPKELADIMEGYGSRKYAEK